MFMFTLSNSLADDNKRTQIYLAVLYLNLINQPHQTKYLGVYHKFINLKRLYEDYKSKKKTLKNSYN